MSMASHRKLTASLNTAVSLDNLTKALTCARKLARRAVLLCDGVDRVRLTFWNGNYRIEDGRDEHNTTSYDAALDCLFALFPEGARLELPRRDA